MTGAAASPCCEASSKSLAGWRKAAACISTAGPARPGWFVYPLSRPVQHWVGSGCPLLCLGQLVEAEPYLPSWGCSDLVAGELLLPAAAGLLTVVPFPCFESCSGRPKPAHTPQLSHKHQEHLSCTETSGAIKTTTIKKIKAKNLLAQVTQKPLCCWFIKYIGMLELHCRYPLGVL